MEIINLDFRIKRLIESKIFVIVVSIITFLCWASNIRFISYAFFSLFLFLIYKTKSNGSSIFSLMMLLFGGDSNYEYKIKPYDILTIIIIAIFGCCALFYIIKDFVVNYKEYVYRIKNEKIIWGLLAILGVFILTILSTNHYGYTLFYISKFLINIALAIVVITKVDIKDSTQLEIVLFSLACVIFTIFAEASCRLIYMAMHYSNLKTAGFGGVYIVHYNSLLEAIKDKQVGLYWAVSNHFIMIVNMCALTQIYYLVECKKENKLIPFIALFLSFLLNIICLCRAGYIALILSFVYLVYVYLGKTRNEELKTVLRRIYISLIALSIVMIMVICIFTKIGDWVINNVLVSTERRILYSRGLKDFKNNWFLGTGAGTSKFNIEPLWDEIKQKVFNYHNSVIQMLATCGIIGIISLLFFWCVCIYKIFKKYNYFSLTIGAVFIYAFVHGLFDTIFVVSISMLFLIALIIIIPNKEYEMLDKEVIE